MNEKVRDFLVVLIAVPIVGILMGGIYSVPAMYITNHRDPWHTLLLGVGLTITVIGVGLVWGIPIPILVGAWIGASIFLCVCRYFQKLDHNVERFGFVHALTLTGMFWLVRLAT